MATITQNTINESLRKLEKDFQKKAIKAIENVSREINKDVDTVEPLIPVDTGFMRSSFVFNKISNVVGSIQWTADYATKVHNWLDPKVHWTRPSSGPLWLVKKLSNPGLQMKYKEIISNILSLKNTGKGK